MNKTRKLTQGAMLLAIVGALMLIDRKLLFIFSVVISLMIPVVIVVYSSMYTIKDGLILSLCLLIISLLCGDPSIVIYYPIYIISGIGYSFGIKKDLDKKKLLWLSIVLFIIGELVAAFIFIPVFLNISIAEQVEALSQYFSELNANLANYSNLIPANFLSGSMIMIVFVFSTVLSGVMEGLIIHLLSVLLLNRFHIKEIKVSIVSDFKPNKFLSYIAIMASMLIFVVPRINNEGIASIFTILSLAGDILLLFYAYLFVLKFGVITKKRLVLPYILCLFLVSYLLIIVGFLYGAGPLNTYLEQKRELK